MSDLIALINKQKPAIKAALPAHITPERMVRIATTALRQTPALARCEPSSVLGSLMLSSQLGLEPNTPLGQAYLIPYKNVCTFIIGYKGLIDLAYRTKQYETIYAMEVYEDDDFDFAYGLDPYLTHKPSRNRSIDDKPIAYYAVYKLIGGGKDFRVMFRDEIEAFAKKYSKSFNKGPWQTDFDAMAKKTVIKQVLKYAPLTVELAQSVSQDQKTLLFKDGEVIDSIDIDVEEKEKTPTQLIDQLDDTEETLPVEE